MLENSGKVPLVSIIITSYNREKWIGKSVESALKQDYTNFEVVISDNCSTDNTKKILSTYMHDKRIKFYENDTNIGMLPNFKKAVEELAKGEYIVILNSDDLLINNSFISKAIRIINTYENVNLVKGKTQNLLEESGKIIGAISGSLFDAEFQKGTDLFLKYSGIEDFSWAGVLINREKLNSLNIFDSSYTGLDVGSNLLLMLMGNVGFINEYCYMFRLHSTNAHISKNAESFIANLMMANIPYDYALLNKLIDINLLEKWKTSFLRYLIRSSLIRLYISQRKEFVIFKNYVQTNYNNIYNDITLNANWKIFLAAYFFPQIGGCIAKAKEFLTANKNK